MGVVLLVADGRSWERTSQVMSGFMRVRDWKQVDERVCSGRGWSWLR